MFSESLEKQMYFINLGFVSAQHRWIWKWLWILKECVCCVSGVHNVLGSPDGVRVRQVPAWQGHGGRRSSCGPADAESVPQTLDLIAVRTVLYAAMAAFALNRLHCRRYSQQWRPDNVTKVWKSANSYPSTYLIKAFCNAFCAFLCWFVACVFVKLFYTF